MKENYYPKSVLSLTENPFQACPGAAETLTIKVRFGILNECGDSCLRSLKEYESGLKMDELPVKCFLYPENHVILAPWVCELQDMVIKMNDSVKNRVQGGFHLKPSALAQRGSRLTTTVVTSVMTTVKTDSPTSCPRQGATILIKVQNR
ncbi:hypothetical protein EVAR_7356_1 [Eumeta japonica]|uniref:Uncharacterized protein n=1 Tax=Eumeta variegata TaxID=151549 RepID=A0A4C1T5S8_EUMVA|nr:hypothetical protein EVAR_7356_1 [Eumeta japonica]